MKKHLPNFITTLNILSGVVAIYFATQGAIHIAAYLIIVAAVFDFFDGFVARILKVYSPIGKELDSLADLVSFGVAPTFIIFHWLNACFESLPPMLQTETIALLPFVAFIVPIFSALRLAKFNTDEKQAFNFYGLPTPANALFLAFIPFAANTIPIFSNFWAILSIVVVFSLLLVIKLWLFSLKFKNFQFKENLIRYIFLLISIAFLVLFQLGAFPLIILVYILISLGYQFLVRPFVS